MSHAVTRMVPNARTIDAKGAICSKVVIRATVLDAGFSFPVVLALVGLTLLARASAFFHVVIDWDESLYALVARELLHGGWPYVAVWENKPPFLFLIIAGFFKALGENIVALRLAGDAAVVAAAYLIYLVGNRFPGSGKALGWAAAVLYVAVTANDGGLASNAEIFAAPFICGALLVASSSSEQRSSMSFARSAWLGLWLGLAIQIKLTVVPEAVAIAGLALLFWRVSWRHATLIVAVAVVPFALGVAAYAYGGHLAAYVDANFLGDLRRVGEWHAAPAAPAGISNAFLGQLGQLRPLSILAPRAAVLVWRHGHEQALTRRLVAAILAWWAIDALTISATNEFNGHQFVSLMAPMALLSGYALWALMRHLPLRRAWMVAAVAIGYLMNAAGPIAQAANIAEHRIVLRDATWGDPDARLGALLRSKMRGNRSLFVMHQQPVLYFLTNSALPTKYAYPPFLEEPSFERVAGIDGAAEVARIRSASPQFIVGSIYVFDADSRSVQAELAQLYPKYRLIFTSDGTMIYQLVRTAKR